PLYIVIVRPPPYTLFPYTTLFRSTPDPVKSPGDEFGVVASKVNLLGQQLRGAQGDFSDLRGNFERLLDDLEDAVMIFGRDRRLRSEEHTSELQSRVDLVCRLLLEK